MILVVDTIKREKINIGLYDGKNLSYFEFETKDQSTDILPAIKGVLKNNKLSLKDITAIAVNQGPGSFTGVRVGVTVANTLAWSLDIPVFGYKDGKLTSALKKILPNKQKNFSQIALPSYTPLKKRK